MGRLGIGLTAALLVAAVAAPALASKPLLGQVENGHKITICHATSSSNLVQYWEVITVDIASTGGRNKAEGHVGHIENAKKDDRVDVIPAFVYDGNPFAGNQVPGGDPGDWEAWLDLNPEGLACEGQVPEG